MVGLVYKKSLVKKLVGRGKSPPKDGKKARKYKIGSKQVWENRKVQMELRQKTTKYLL